MVSILCYGTKSKVLVQKYDRPVTKKRKIEWPNRLHTEPASMTYISIWIIETAYGRNGSGSHTMRLSRRR